MREYVGRPHDGPAWLERWGIYSKHGVCQRCPSLSGGYHARKAVRVGNTVTYYCYYGYPKTHTWKCEILEGDPDWQDLDRTYTPEEQQLDTRIDGKPERREAA